MAHRISSATNEAEYGEDGGEFARGRLLLSPRVYTRPHSAPAPLPEAFAVQKS